MGVAKWRLRGLDSSPGGTGILGSEIATRKGQQDLRREQDLC